MDWVSESESDEDLYEEESEYRIVCVIELTNSLASYCFRLYCKKT
jgi:hypothetical protein